MKVGVKIAVGFLVMMMLIAVSNVGGYRGVSSLAEHLEYITGPAWDATDGSMEATIELQSEMLIMYRFLEGFISLEEAKPLMASARERAGIAVQILENTGIAEQQSIEQLRALLEQYDREKVR